MKKLLALSLMLLVISAAACTQSHLVAQPAMEQAQHSPIETKPAAGPLATLPALPELDGARTTSDCDFTPLLQYGDAAIASAPSAQPDNAQQLMLLTAPADDASWALYQFNGFDSSTHPSNIELLVNDASDQKLYFALANYEKDHWDLSSVDLIGQDGDLESIRVDIADDSPYRSPVTDSIYFVVLVYDDVHVEVRSVSVQFGIRNVWVQNISATDGSDPDAITITWDAVPNAVSYEVYYRFYNFPGQLKLLGETSETMFTHSTTEPVGKEAIQGEPYIYFVAAKYADGTCSQLSGYDVGVTSGP